MGFQLVVVRGRSSIGAHRLGPGVTVAGRQEGCQLLIKSSQVSRRHCEIFEQKGRLIVKDLGSANGTLVNGERIDGSHALAPGDELSIGGVLFRVEQAGAATTPAPKPSDTAVTRAPEETPEDLVLVDEDEEPAEPILIEDEEEAPPAVPTPSARVAANSTPAKKAPEPAAPAGATELGEEAVADFLLSIDLDDDKA